MSPETNEQYWQPPIARGHDLPEPPGATMIFVLGLLSLITCAPLGIIAWWMGSAERARVRAGQYRESGLLTAGYVMGIVATLLLVIPLLIFALVMFFMVVFGALGAAASATSLVLPL